MIQNREDRVSPLGTYLFVYYPNSEGGVNYPSSPDAVFAPDVEREEVEKHIPNEAIGYVLTTIGSPVVKENTTESIQWDVATEDQKDSMLLSVPERYTAAFPSADWFFLAALETMSVSKTYLSPFIQGKFEGIEEIDHSSIGKLGGLASCNSWS